MATDWNQLTVSELKSELSARKLPIGGKKADLVKRILNFDAGESDETETTTEEQAEEAMDDTITEEQQQDEGDDAEKDTEESENVHRVLSFFSHLGSIQTTEEDAEPDLQQEGESEDGAAEEEEESAVEASEPAGASTPEVEGAGEDKDQAAEQEMEVEPEGAKVPAEDSPTKKPKVTKPATPAKAKSTAKVEVDYTKLYLTCFHRMTKKILQEWFPASTKVELPVGRQTQRRGGYAFVHFPDRYTCKSAFDSMQGRMHEGQPIIVKFGRQPLRLAAKKMSSPKKATPAVVDEPPAKTATVKPAEPSKPKSPKPAPKVQRDLPSIDKMWQELKNGRSLKGVGVCCIGMNDLSHPVIHSCIENCSYFNTAFYTSKEDDTQTWKGMLRLYYSKEADLTQAAEKLATIRDELLIKILYPKNSQDHWKRSIDKHGVRVGITPTVEVPVCQIPWPG